MTRHQYGIFAVLPQTSILRETNGGVANAGCFLRLSLEPSEYFPSILPESIFVAREQVLHLGDMRYREDTQSKQNSWGLTSLAFAQLDPGRPKGPPYLHSGQFSFSYGTRLRAGFTFQNNETAAMLVLWKLNLFLLKELSFVSINLHRHWPLEWKRSIECKMKGLWLIFIQ